MSRAGPNAELGEGVQALAKANSKLERMLAKIGTQADTPDFRDRMHSEQTASTQLVKHLMVQLKRLSASGPSTLQQRLTSQFDREFKKFQALNTQMDQKQVRVIDAVKQKRRASGAQAGSQYDEEDPLTATQQRAYESDSNTFAQQQQQAQQQAMADLDVQFIEYDVGELEQRASEIRKIEQDVLEVSEMYRDLSSMVAEQQEHIDSIEANIHETKEKTESGHQQLLEAEEYQKKTRKKKCCMLFLILTVIAVVVVIVYAVDK